MILPLFNNTVLALEVKYSLKLGRKMIMNDGFIEIWRKVAWHISEF
jgi:hypothetical protein